MLSISTSVLSFQSELQLTQASAHAPASQGTSHVQNTGGRQSTALSGTKQAKLLSEIDVVQRNIDVMNEILIENQPGKEEEGIVPLMEVSYLSCTTVLKLCVKVGIEYNHS